MLTNIESIEDLSGLARARARDYETRTVNPALVAQMVSEGWTVDQENKKSVRLRRPKPHGVHLEDRVWTLLYRMKFSLLSAQGGAKLVLNPKDSESLASQIDVVAIDSDVAIAIECKSAEKPSKRPQFQQDLGKHSLVRDRFGTAIRLQFDSPHKRRYVLGMFVSNILLSENDRARARQENFFVVDEHELGYYESLVSQIGPAAKYQLLADMLPGKPVPGLEIRIPAIKTKMGGLNCYTFSISPEYLLKISYVSHRSKGRGSDVITYQRMLSKTRLKAIKQYIADDGIFPTNIVVNFEKNRLQFEPIRQESTGNGDSGVCGWLDIRAAYKSAWIIDGQHRLYAYSGHERAPKSRLSVLAFDGLESSKEAELFIDINSKQKSVKRSLLQELFADLHSEAEEPALRVRAIISRAIQNLDVEPDSPLYQRIQTADVERGVIRCVSLTSLYGAMDKPEFFIAREKHGEVVEYGPLWDGNDGTLRRTELVLKEWLNTIKIAAGDWWDKGAGEGGGLAMNDGLIVCINVLRSVFQHHASRKLIRLNNEDLVEVLRKYATALGEYLGSLPEQERKEFRARRGIQGQTYTTRKCQAAIRHKLPDFNPSGLDEFIKQTEAQTNIRGTEIVHRIEKKLQKVILEELRREFGEDESGWWMLGVPNPVRKKVSELYEDDRGQRGGREYYFDLIDFQKIASSNWNLFKSLLGYGGSGSKEKQLSWLNFVNAKRNILAHPVTQINMTQEEVAQLESYDRWLDSQISAPPHEVNDLIVAEIS